MQQNEDLLDHNPNEQPPVEDSFSYKHVVGIPLLMTVPFFLLGMFFKLQSWPCASDVLFYSMLFFAVLSALAYYIEYQLQDSFDLFLFIQLIGIDCFWGGMLCRIESWPYASELRWIGIIILVGTSFYSLFRR